MRLVSLAALVGSLLVCSLVAPAPVSPSSNPVAAVLSPCDGGDGLYLYADRDYAGACFKITADTPRLGDVGFNDVTSSLRFVGSFAGGHRRAELYVDGNYGGSVQIVSSDVPWMGNTAVGNDKLSSVRLGFTCAGVSQIPQMECQALVDLYNQTSGPGWTDRTGWLTTATPCTWYGVQCRAGHVSSLELVNNHLTGGLPTSLTNLGGLERLFLYNNELSGSIPSQLGSMASLKYLLLSDNNLTGGIPSTLGNLASLSWLALDANHLTGTIPPTLRYLHHLNGLRIDHNSLGGALPLELMDLTALELFHFEETGLCEPPDPAFQAWLTTMLELGSTNVHCAGPSPTPTTLGSVRVYLPVLTRGYTTWSDDEFTSPALDGRWTWVNEDPTAWSVTARPGFLRLRTHSGGVGDKNLLLRPVPAGDWAASTRVEFAPARNFQGAGLVVWGGPGSLLKLQRAFCDLGPPNCIGDGIYFDHIEGGVWVGSNFAFPWPATSPVYLAIERAGAEYVGLCSLNGQDWTWLGSHTAGFTVLGVGLSADQGTPGATAEADFDFFRAYVALP